MKRVWGKGFGGGWGVGGGGGPVGVGHGCGGDLRDLHAGSKGGMAERKISKNSFEARLP